MSHFITLTMVIVISLRITPIFFTAVKSFYHPSSSKKNCRDCYIFILNISLKFACCPTNYIFISSIPIFPSFFPLYSNYLPTPLLLFYSLPTFSVLLPYPYPICSKKMTLVTNLLHLAPVTATKVSYIFYAFHIL